MGIPPLFVFRVVTVPPTAETYGRALERLLNNPSTRTSCLYLTNAKKYGNIITNLLIDTATRLTAQSPS